MEAAVLYDGWPRNCKNPVQAIPYSRFVFFLVDSL